MDKTTLDSQVAGVVILNYGLWTGSATYRLRDQDDQRMDNHLWRQEVLFTISRRLW